MSIVKLSTCDIEKVLSLENGFSDGWNYNQLKTALESGRFFILGKTDNQELIAFVCYSIAMEQADIEIVFVKAERRRKGLAKQLIQNAQADMQAKGVQKAFLEVRETNLSARALYSSLGYQEISVRKGYYPDKENAVIMAKELL